MKKNIVLLLLVVQVLSGCTEPISNSTYESAPDLSETATPVVEEEASSATETKSSVVKKEAYIEVDSLSNIKRTENNAFYLTGTTSDNCSKIVIRAINERNGIDDTYQLQDYRHGDTRFKYGIREDWNNLGPDQNYYIFTAYCDENQIKRAGKVLTYVPPSEEKNIEEDIESEIQAIPVEIQEPVPVNIYETPINVNNELSNDGCNPNYSGCVPIASDVDCAGGSGNGPAYVRGPVRVLGVDVYDLDRDKDGIGCE